MTTEVVVMNKVAVAMAADSAVTVTAQSGNKIYNSANKLFGLSRYCPVGVMIYGSAELMGIPWETIIKLYRDDLGRKKFDTLNEYAQSFITYLREHVPEFFTEEHQDAYFNTLVITYLQAIKSATDNQLTVLLNQGLEINEKIKEQALENIVDNELQTLQNSEDLPSLPNGIRERIIDKHGLLIRGFIEPIMEGLPLSDETTRKLVQFMALINTKNLFLNAFSGVVFSGFGEKEIFPSMTEFKIENVTDNYLKYIQESVDKIAFNQPVIIKSFAQSDMISMFMEGVHADYNQTIWNYISGIIENYPNSILNSIPQLSEDERKSLSEKLKGVGDKMLADLQEQIGRFQYTRYINPITNNVSFLPVNELAGMAESLVNITSFKRKVSLEEETVGGPIDVAVISKKDGFIWIKRKHYFTSDLNRDYFASKYEESDTKND